MALILSFLAFGYTVLYSESMHPFCPTIEDSISNNRCSFRQFFHSFYERSRSFVYQYLVFERFSTQYSIYIALIIDLMGFSHSGTAHSAEGFDATYLYATCVLAFAVVPGFRCAAPSSQIKRLCDTVQYLYLISLHRATVFGRRHRTTLRPHQC